MSIGTQWRFDAGVLAWDPIPLAREKRVLLFFPECQDCHRWSPVFDAPWELTISLMGSLLCGGAPFNLFISGYTGIYSDFDTNEQLVAAHGEIVRGICLANGIEYKMAALLLPESEE